MNEQTANGRLRVGVTGVGHLGIVHARLWKTIDGVDLVGIHDMDGARAESVAADLYGDDTECHVELIGPTVGEPISPPAPVERPDRSAVAVSDGWGGTPRTHG